MSETRVLASVEKVVDVFPIEKADKLEGIYVKNWSCVTKKDDFHKDDLCLYLEIDSLLPEADKRFEFMRERKFRVRSIKLRGQISQGLAMPLKDFPEIKKPVEGMDVTDLLKVKKYISAEEKEPTFYVKKDFQIAWWVKPFANYIKRFELTRYWLGFLVGIKRTGQSKFPSFLPKTDEPRLQNCYGKVSKYFNHDIGMIPTMYMNRPVTMKDANTIIGGMDLSSNESDRVAITQVQTVGGVPQVVSSSVDYVKIVKDYPQLTSTMDYAEKPIRWYISNKNDGTSFSIYYNQGLSGTASRQVNLYAKKDYKFMKDFFDGQNVYADADKKYKIVEKLTGYCKKNKRNLSIQGEITSPHIQKNRLGLTELNFNAFNLYDIDKKRYCDFMEFESIMKELEIPIVDILERDIIFTPETHTFEWFLNYAKKVKYASGNMAEGIVVRPMKEIYDNSMGRVSFKVINPDYLIKYEL